VRVALDRSSHHQAGRRRQIVVTAMYLLELVQ